MTIADTSRFSYAVNKIRDTFLENGHTAQFGRIKPEFYGVLDMHQRIELTRNLNALRKFLDELEKVDVGISRPVNKE